MSRRMRWQGLATAAALGVLNLGASAAPPGRMSAVSRIDPVQASYLEQCGGCHGIQGVSNPIAVPVLRGEVAQFLCTRTGREYLIRLPSVATSPLSDEQIAKLMNFVVFSLGASGTAPHAPPFTAHEVHELRRRPLNQVSLLRYRTTLVEELIRRCGASPSLLTYGRAPVPASH